MPEGFGLNTLRPVPRMFKLVITGDREWDDEALIYHVLRTVGPRRIRLFVHGACRGADLLGASAAERLGIPLAAYHVTSEEWRRIGPRAGVLRNQQMLDAERPDVWLAFHDDIASSKGTADMVRRCRAARLPGHIFTHAEPDVPAWLTRS